MNKVVLLGRLTADPQCGTTSAGKHYARFTLAVNRFGDGADFINILAWDKHAENVNKFCKKGKQIAIAGRIQTGKYERDGVTHTTFDVIVENLEFVGSNNTDSHSDASIDTLKEVDEDDDMPF